MCGGETTVARKKIVTYRTRMPGCVAACVCSVLGVPRVRR